MTRYCSALGDLSTALEMTVLFLTEKNEGARDDGVFFSRHFDQVKRVEKSPKAKPYFVVKKRFTTIITACRVYTLVPKAKQNVD